MTKNSQLKDSNLKKTARLLMLLFALCITVMVTLIGVRLFTRAGTDVTPKGITLSNISENSASIIFQTDTSSGFVLSYAKQQAPEKTEQIEPTIGRLHYFTLKNLQSNSVYEYYLKYGGKDFGPYTFRTYPISTNPPRPHEVYGKTEKGAVVTLSLKEKSSNQLSTTTNEQGNYSFDLGNLRDLKTLERVTNLSGNDKLSLTIINQQLQTSQKTHTVSQGEPFPDVVFANSQKEKTWWENFTSLFSK